MEHWSSYLPVLGLCMLRPLGVFLLVPLLTTANLGALVRNALLLMIAMPLVRIYPEWPHSDYGVWGYFLIAAGELCIGLVIGFCAALPFWALDMAGFIIDTMRGSSMASVLNPLLGQQSSPFGILFTQIFTVLFMITGCFNQLIEAIYRSYLLFPPGEFLHYSQQALIFIGAQWQLMYELTWRKEQIRAVNRCSVATDV